MSDETQLSGDIEFSTPLLQPAELADPAEPGLTWLWNGYLAQQKVTAHISQFKSGKARESACPQTALRFGNQVADCCREFALSKTSLRCVRYRGC